jgi:hypothetical protein
MGRFGYGPGIGGEQASVASSGPVNPTFGSGSSGSTGFQPRGFPERVSPDQLIPESMAGDAVEIFDKYLARGPATVYERPLALAGQILGMPEGGTPLDPVADFFQDLPVVGEHLGNAGALAMGAFSESNKLIHSVANAGHASSLQSLVNRDPNETVRMTDLPNSFSTWAANAGWDIDQDPTVGEVLGWARANNWAQGDLDDLAANRKGWFDYPDKPLPMAADLLITFGLDPLNLATFGAPGLIAKAGTMAAKAMGLIRVTQASTRATKALTSLPALSAKASATAIASGQGARATTEGLAEYLSIAARGGWNDVRVLPSVRTPLGYAAKHPLSAYRRVALGTTAAQVGVNTVDTLVPDDWVISDVLEPVFQAARQMGERKPLSENDLFALVSLFGFPVRSMVSSGKAAVYEGRVVTSPLTGTATRTGGINAGRRFSHEAAVLKELLPDLPYAEARAAMVARLGGEASFTAAMQQILKTAIHQKNALEGVGDYVKRYSHNSLSEIGFHVGGMNRAINRAIGKSLKEGYLTNKDAVRALHSFTQGRGGILDDLTGGVEQAGFDAEMFVRSWQQWEPLAAATSRIFPNGTPIVPGVMEDVLVAEGVDWMKLEAKIATDADGTILGRDVAEIINSQPAILHTEGAESLSQYLTRDGLRRRADAKTVQEALSAARINATPAVDAFASQASREGWATGTRLRTLRANQRFNADDTLADDVNPALSQADLIIQTTERRQSRQALVTHGLGFTENMRGQRAHVGSIVRDEQIPRALELGGKKVLSAVQVGIMHKGSTKSQTLVVNSGLAIRLSPSQPVGDMIETGALAVQAAKADRGTLVLRGDDHLASKGLTPNGVEHTWNVGRLTAQEWDETAALLERFGIRATLNDTTGLVRVIVPNADATAAKGLEALTSRFGTSVKDNVNFRDIIANQKKVTRNDPAGSVLLADAISIAERNQRYHRTKSYLDDALVGGTAKERARRARGTPDPDRAAPGTARTRWELGAGGGVRRRTGEHAVVADDLDPETFQAITDHLNAVGVRDTNPKKPFRFRPGDTLYATAERNAGAVVRASDGELVIWLRHDVAGRRLPAPDDFGSVISQASEHATWTRIIDRRDSHGVSPIDRLADHGWVPVARSTTGKLADTVVWLVRDPDQAVGRIPPLRTGSKGGWASMADEVPKMEAQSARGMAVHNAEMLQPERTARARQAAKDADLLAKHEQIARLDREIADLQAAKTQPSKSSVYREKVAERQKLLLETSTTAAKTRHDEILARQVAPGNITFVKGIEDDVAMYHPWLDESLEADLATLPPGEIDKLMRLQFDIRRDGGWYDDAGVFHNGTDYTLKVVPKHGTPYYVDQGQAYTSVMQGHMAMADTIRDKVTSGVSQAQSVLFDRVYSRDLARMARQEVYNELLGIGASAKESNRFLAALRHAWETQDSQFMGAKPRKTMDAMAPGKINAIARGQLTIAKDGKVLFDGFSKNVKADQFDFGTMMQRTGSRTFRNLAAKYPAEPGHGHLGKLIEQWYGKETGGLVATAGAGTRKAVFQLAFGYHLLRFMLDPRWYAMNLLEADWLAMARYGWKARKNARDGSLMDKLRNRPGKPVAKDPAIEALGGGNRDLALMSPEETLQLDGYAAGWMDLRNLYGYVRNASRLQRSQSSRKIIQEAIDGGSPVIDDLKARWGENPTAWVDELEDQLYSIDAKGVKATVLADPTAVQMRNYKGPESHLYDEFLERVFDAHRKGYQDIVHTFHGNVNRSNLERLFNSPLLWWPLSYQLKTGKWLIDVLTKQFAGRRGPEMLGTATLAVLLGDHQYAMENNPEYAKLFDEHPALWRSISMFFPLTPFDMGVFMARWTRYSGSWIGAQLGLWDQDPSYPQDPYNFIQRSLNLGPIFSGQILESIFGEFEDPT